MNLPGGEESVQRGGNSEAGALTPRKIEGKLVRPVPPLPVQVLAPGIRVQLGSTAEGRSQLLNQLDAPHTFSVTPKTHDGAPPWRPLQHN
jgi:hypothetical protein